MSGKRQTGNVIESATWREEKGRFIEVASFMREVGIVGDVRGCMNEGYEGRKLVLDGAC